MNHDIGSDQQILESFQFRFGNLNLQQQQNKHIVKNPSVVSPGL